jgi:hypothetical protein
MMTDRSLLIDSTIILILIVYKDLSAVKTTKRIITSSCQAIVSLTLLHLLETIM